MKKIGIISGMGASAGGRLYDLLIKTCQKNGAKKDCDFPEIFLHNIPSKGMSEKGMTNPNVVKKELLDSVELLNHAGAEIIMIACNTVHLYHQYLQERSFAEILNMVDLSCEYVKGCGQVGVLSSSTTKNSLLYEKSLKNFGVECIQSTPKQQKVLDEKIRRVMCGEFYSSDKKDVFYICNEMMLLGAKKIIMGCTELPLLGLSGDYIVDPSQVMIDAL